MHICKLSNKSSSVHSLSDEERKVEFDEHVLKADDRFDERTYSPRAKLSSFVFNEYVKNNDNFVMIAASLKKDDINAWWITAQWILNEENKNNFKKFRAKQEILGDIFVQKKILPYAIDPFKFNNYFGRKMYLKFANVCKEKLKDKSLSSSDRNEWSSQAYYLCVLSSGDSECKNEAKQFIERSLRLGSKLDDEPSEYLYNRVRVLEVILKKSQIGGAKFLLRELRKHLSPIFSKLSIDDKYVNQIAEQESGKLFDNFKQKGWDIFEEPLMYQRADNGMIVGGWTVMYEKIKEAMILLGNIVEGGDSEETAIKLFEPLEKYAKDIFAKEMFENVDGKWEDNLRKIIESLKSVIDVITGNDETRKNDYQLVIDILMEDMPKDKTKYYENRIQYRLLENTISLMEMTIFDYFKCQNVDGIINPEDWTLTKCLNKILEKEYFALISKDTIEEMKAFYCWVEGEPSLDIRGRFVHKESNITATIDYSYLSLLILINLIWEMSTNISGIKNKKENEG